MSENSTLNIQPTAGTSSAERTNKARQLRLSLLHQILGDRYQLKAYLGRGAFATVYLARNRHLERFEAIKVLSETLDDRRLARRFVEEAKVVASLDHPNIVKVYDYGEVDGILWCAMQYVDGPTLRAELRTRGQIEQQQAIRLVLPLLEGLEHSHRHGIVHRDVKPSNILLSSEGRPYLMDFGIAKSTHGGLRTMTGNVLGTPHYIAPEQVAGGQIDGRADLYAISATLYELLSGRPPFSGETAVQTMLKRLKQDPEPLASLLPQVDPRLEAVVRRGLARDARKRFASAAEMHHHLAALQSASSDNILVPRARAPQRRSTEINSLSTASEASRARRSESSDTTMRLTLAPATRLWLLLLASALIVLALAGRWIWQQRPAETPFADSETQLPRLAVQAGDSRSPPAVGPPATTQPPAEAPPPSKPTAMAERPSTRAATPSTTAASREASASAIPRRALLPPKILQSVEPKLDPTQVEQCSGQEVIITVRVGENGRAAGARVLRSGHPTCAEAARRAAEAYFFQPASDAAGQPVASSITIFIGFGGQ